MKLLAAEVRINGMVIKDKLSGIDTLADVVNRMVPFIISLGGVLLFLILVWGGYDVMMSQGNPEKMKSGKAKITTAIVGFILLILSYFITKLISTIFGFGQGIL